MDPAPQPPTVLGEFRVLAVLGEGGSGVVYDATWGPRRVALKVLHPTRVQTGKERAQFLTEAQRLQQITHPSVVKVLAVGQLPDGRPYLAMERLDGDTLASVIARGALPLARALEMFGELADAVQALHAQGLVHRDLKPENVFVVADRHAVLLDFGIAKDLDAPASTTTQEGSVRGTPAYMAPERFFGQPAGIPTDVYELALVLYVMLAGRLPWDDLADPEARLSPRSLCELAPVPEALDIEIRRALSTRAQNRPASAVSLLEAVRVAASASATEPEPAETARLRSAAHASVAPTDGPERAPAVQSTPLAWAPTQAATVQRPRSRWPLGAAAVALLAVGGIAIGFALRSEPARVPADAGAAAAIASDARRIAADDPWAEPPAGATQPAIASGEDRLPAERYRAEAAAAVQKLAKDTRLVFSVQIGELRAVSATRDLLDKLLAHPKVATLGLLLPACVKTLAADAEWLVFGAPGLAKSDGGTLIVRGRWERRDIEACAAAAAAKQVHVGRGEGATLYRVGSSGWLDFLDDQTAYISLDARRDARAVHALVTGGGGPVTKVKRLLAGLPAARTIAIAMDGASRDDLSMLALPKGSDLVGWIRAEPAGLALDLAADPHEGTAAAALVRRIEPQVAELFQNASATTVGRLEVVREGTTVHLRGNLTSFMLGIMTAGLTL